MLKLTVGLGVLLLAGCATREPPGGSFVKMSQVASFPPYLRGLGTLYVQPDSVPIGPYYGYSRQGRLINAVYMVPLKLFDTHTAENSIKGTPLPVDHIDLHYTNGHPGVAEPHYHIILWFISPDEAAQVE